jgi:hypothetical protein
MPYILDGQTFKVQFANIAAVGAVPSTRVIASGTGLAGGGDLSADRVISIAAGGVGVNQLSLTGVTAGTYGSGSDVPVLTVDATGRVTSVTTAALSVTGFVPTSRTITAGNGLTGGGSLASDITLSASFSATTPLALGIASPGVAITLSRGDHVHPALDLSDTNQTQGALPLGRGGTGDALSPVAGAVVYSTGTKFAVSTAGAPGQILVSNGTAAPSWTNVGAGTVTSVAVATANGLAGTVANPTVSPVITLSTTVTGVVKGDGTTLSAATAGTDYVAPGAYTTSGLTMAAARLLGRTTASIGAAQELTVGTGLTLASGSLVNAAPDQVVSLTGAGTTTITGTYPSFTITSNDSTAGTVTSVNASGGTTGMSFTGGPVTSAGTLTLNGTLAVANGGTGAIDAPTALTNLGAYPASNPSGFTSNVGTVTSVSGTGTVSGLSLSGTVTSTGSLTLGGTLAVLPSNFASQTANTVLAAPNGSAGVPTFRAIVAADVPTLNQNTTGTASNVTGIVAVLNGGTGASVAGTARTNLLAAGSGANTDITSIALTTGTVSTTPTSGTDLVNKAYADSIASGINFHQSVRLATAAALPANTYNNGASGVGATLTGNANGALTVDGVAAVVGNRILVKDEVTQANNGVYTVTQVGSGAAVYILTRATDFDSAGSGVDQIDAGDFFLVTAGTTQSNTSWVQQTPLPIVVGTTAIVFTQFAAPVLYSAGTGLTLAGTVFSITNTGVAASTYGSASSVPVIAINAQGQVTSASDSSISIAGSQITSGTVAIANGGTGATSAPTALTNLGAYPASNPSGFTSNTGTVTSINLTAGTGVSVSGGPITASGSITVTNTAPDQVVALTGSGATTVTGTYPNFTISSPASGAGTVTSIDVSGGTTGLTTSGGPVTSSGTITLAGTLNVANGGTGATTLTSGYLLKGNGTSAVSASVVYDDGTNVGIGTASPQALFTISSGAGTKAVWQTTRSFTVNRNFQLAVDEYVEGAFTITPSTTLGGSTYTTPAVTVTGTGNVGIGATTTNGKLTIKNPSASGDQVILNVQGASNTQSIGRISYNQTDDTMRLFNESTFAGSGLLFGTNNSEKMRIDVSGNVGIGTASPGVKLDVQGATPFIRVKENTTGYLGLRAENASGNFYFGIDSSTGSFFGSAYARAVYADGAYPMTFYTNATERMRISSAGYVGIGTTSSSIKLQVSDVDQATARIGVQNVNGQNYHLVAGNPGASNTGFAIFDATASATRMYLDSSGNVGIGTTSPGSALQVNGNIRVSNGTGFVTANSLVRSIQTMSGSANQFVSSNIDFYTAAFTDNGQIAFSTGGAEAMRINGSSNVGIGTASPAYKLQAVSAGAGASEIVASNTAGGERIHLISRNSAGISYAQSQNSQLLVGTFDNYALQFMVNNTTRMLVDTSGNVGIGTSSPAYKLDVNGVTRLGAGSPAILAGVGGAFVGGQGELYTVSTNTMGLGTTGAASMQLYTNSVERMRITSTGNVGIGTSSPLANLHVVGAAASTSVSPPAGTQILAHAGGYDTGAFGASLNFVQQWWSGAPTSLISVGQITGLKTAGNGNFGGGLAFFVGPSGAGSSTMIEAMRIDGNSGGNVGIGTTAPSQRLDVSFEDTTTNRTSPINVAAITATSTAAAGPVYTGFGPALVFRSESYDGTTYAGPRVRMAIGDDSISTTAGSSLAFDVTATKGASPTEAMRITPSGDVLIGSTDVFGKLTLRANANSALDAWIRNDSAGSSARAGIILNASGNSWRMGMGSSANNSNALTWDLDVSSPSEKMRLDTSGNLGIGTSSPGAKLTVIGSASKLYVDLSGDNYYDAANHVFRNFAGTERMRIDSSGNLLVGTTTASYSASGRGVAILGGSASGLLGFQIGGVAKGYVGHFDSSMQMWNEAASPILFGTSATERMRINSSGNVGIGTTSPSTKLVVSNSGAAGLEFEPTGGINGGSYIQSYNRSTSAYTHNTNYASAQTWYVGNGSRAMDLTSSGQLLIGTTTAVQTLTIGGGSSSSSGINLRTTQTDFVISPSNTAAGGVSISTSWVNGGQGPLIFTNANGEIMRLSAARGLSVGTTTDAGSGNILASGNVTAYSDIRVKGNVEQIAGALDRIQRIRGVTYTRTDLEDTERRYAGVIAQEIEEVLPEAIFDSGELKAVDYNATIGLLIEAIKELTARVAQLEGK